LGQNPGNPTLYFEYVHPNDGASWGEVRLLLGGAIVPRWYWGANLSYDRRFGDLREVEYQITGAFSWAAIDSKLSIGGEAQLELLSDRNTPLGGVELLVGPSLQWRPIKAAHVDLVWLVGPEWARSNPSFPLVVAAVNQPTIIAGWMF
jgi:hypothetical protein